MILRTPQGCLGSGCSEDLKFQKMHLVASSLITTMCAHGPPSSCSPGTLCPGVSHNQEPHSSSLVGLEWLLPRATSLIQQIHPAGTLSDVFTLNTFALWPLAAKGS